MPQDNPTVVEEIRDDSDSLVESYHTALPDSFYGPGGEVQTELPLPPVTYSASEPEIECEHCCSSFPTDEASICEGETICDNCRCNTSECAECSNTFFDDNLSGVRDARNRSAYVCETCLSNHYCTCADCSDHVHCEQAESVGDDNLCPACYSDNYFYCEGCSRSRHNDDYGQDGRCSDCSETDEDSGLRSYSYKPKGIFTGHRCTTTDAARKNPEAFIGVEIEVECVHSFTQGEVIETVESILGDNFYCKEDGSLRNGVEIVSHPYALKKFPFDRLRSLCKKLRTEGVRSFTPGTCGIHVHISKNAVPDNGDRDRTIWRALRAIAPQCAALSKRERFGFCNMPQPYSEVIRHATEATSGCWCSQCEERRRLGASGKLNPCPDLPQGNDHNSAINFGNEHTIEVRFFRGTLNPESCVNSIKFAHHLLLFLASVSRSRLTAIESGKLPASHLWGELLASLPKHLRQWAINRSDTAGDYRAYEESLRDKGGKAKARLPKDRCGKADSARILEITPEINC